MRSCFLIVFFIISLTFATRFVSEFIHPSGNNLNSPSAIRIVGGKEAALGQIPYQIGIYIQFPQAVSFCGGSLISEKYILTAAHCLEGALSVEVIMGVVNISSELQSPLTRETQISKNFTIHPDWNKATLTNDLAIITLTESVKLNNNVKIISTPTTSTDTYAGKEGITSGWGKTSDSSHNEVENILHYESNTIISNTDCKRVNSAYDAVIKNTHLCLSGDGKKGICSGDSGGPLVVNNVLVGVTSFNYVDCEAGNPSVFTRISEYIQWIKENSYE